ncbi:MAG: hypothetical protein M0R02_14305, partial [Bacteroidales bacterium]|nr:hypothetical protein [Bacteroidales bacterium]
GGTNIHEVAFDAPGAEVHFPMFCRPVAPDGTDGGGGLVTHKMSPDWIVFCGKPFDWRPAKALGQTSIQNFARSASQATFPLQEIYVAGL